MKATTALKEVKYSPIRCINHVQRGIHDHKKASGLIGCLNGDRPLNLHNIPSITCSPKCTFQTRYFQVLGWDTGNALSSFFFCQDRRCVSIIKRLLHVHQAERHLRFDEPLSSLDVGLVNCFKRNKFYKVASLIGWVKKKLKIIRTFW